MIIKDYGRHFLDEGPYLVSLLKRTSVRTSNLCRCFNQLLSKLDLLLSPRSYSQEYLAG